MVTTIQLNEDVKKALDKIKSNKETYEQAIVKLMNLSEKYTREQEQALIEGYKEMAEEGIRVSRAWDSTLMDGLSKETW